MIHGALLRLRLEVDRTEALDLFGQVDARGIELALELVHACRIDLLAHLRAFVVGLERFADLLAVVHEVEDEGVFLERVDAVQPRQRLHGLNARQPLVHVHRVQERLVEAGLVLLGHEQHLVLLRGELLGQLLLPDAAGSCPLRCR